MAKQSKTPPDPRLVKAAAMRVEAIEFANKMARSAFSGRKGHGNKEPRYRNLSEPALAYMLGMAYEAGAQAVEAKFKKLAGFEPSLGAER